MLRVALAWWRGAPQHRGMNRSTLLRLSAATAAIALAPPVAAQSAAAPPPGYTMPSTAMWDMAADSGEVYRVMVSYPAGEPPERGYPVLYVLDGNAMFAGFAETRRMLEWKNEGKAIVVGVGYPTDKAYDERRLYDLTGEVTDVPAYARFRTMRAGGWDKFLDFLTGKLRREIGTRWKTDARRQSLFGHSLGGLFALHALHTRPGAFHAIVAASPTLYWHEKRMRQEERDFAAGLKSGRIDRVSRLLVVAGEREEDMLERMDPEDYVKRIEPLSAFGLRVRSQIYADEGHMTVPSRAVTDTLRFVFAWP